jgi:hypothetical protein
MDGPGRYLPAPTEGIPDGNDLPAPHVVASNRDQQQTPCPRGAPSASRHTSGKRTGHDVGNLSTGHPVALLVASASHDCGHGTKPCTMDLTDLAPPGSPDTPRVIALAVRVVGDDGVSSRAARWHLWRTHRVCAPCATLPNGAEAGGKTGPGASPRRVARVGP